MLSPHHYTFIKVKFLCVWGSQNFIFGYYTSPDIIIRQGLIIRQRCYPKGSFYEPELQKTSQELFRIEKVIKRGKKKSLVKWKGYSDDFNSWVDNKDIVNIS